MNRLDTNRDFLNNFVHSTLAKSKSLLKIASDEEIKSILECLINIEQLSFSILESKKIKTKQKVIESILNQANKNLNNNRRLLQKHIKDVKDILASILLSTLEFELCTILAKDGTSDEGGD